MRLLLRVVQIERMMNVEMFSVAEIEVMAVLLPYVCNTHPIFILFFIYF